MKKILEKQGLKFLLKTKVSKITKIGQHRVKLEIENDSGKKEVIFY
jgi:pyruvate/2-oxoglutarate dehydrogenase complex dihydrolipoamide dehydrogenase (E3) component